MDKDRFNELLNLREEKDAKQIFRVCKAIKEDDIAKDFFVLDSQFFLAGEDSTTQITEEMTNLYHFAEEKAVEGDEQARYILAQYCKYGYQVVEMNDVEYLTHLMILAKDGFLPAIRDLAFVYLNGDCGLYVDYNETYSLFKKGADLQDEQCKVMCAVCLLNGFGSKQNTKKGIKALKSFKNPLAFFIIGKMYEDGKVLKKKDRKAFKYYKKSAQKKYRDALFALYRCYLYGIGTGKSIEKAYNYLDTAMKCGSLLAREEYGLKYFYGRNEQKNYPKAIEYFKLAIRDNRALQAKKILASCYEKGLYVPLNEEKAFVLYKSCADINLDSDSMIKVGNMFNEGIGTYKSEQSAFEYYQKSAKLNNALGKYYLSKYYSQGLFVEKDTNKSIELLESACSKNIPEAKVELAILLYKGTYEKANYQRAYELLQEAVNFGNREAYYHLGFLFEYGVGIFKSDTEAFEMYKNGAKFGDEKCAIKLADFYINGRGTPCNHQMGIDIYSKYAVLGNADAMAGLAVCYKNGLGVKTDIHHCRDLLSDAIKIGGGKAFYEIGRLYEDGKGVRPSLIMAHNYYLKATEYDYIDAYYKCGLGYYLGNSGRKDFQEAFKFFEKGAYSNHVECQYYLAKFYENGYAVETDKDLAIYWYEEAIKRGDTNSLLPLGIIYFNAQKFDSAIKLFKSCKDGLAYRFLSIIYKNGYGVEPNKKLSDDYYKEYVSFKNRTQKSKNLIR